MDLTPFIHEWLVPFLTLLGAGLVLWVGVHLKGWLAAHAGFLSAEQREKIAGLEEKALDAGVQYVIAWVDNQGTKVHPVVNSWLLREGAQVAIDHAGGVLADNGLDPNTAANKILAKLPPMFVTTDVNQAAILPTAYLGKVDVSPLPPIQKAA